MKQEIDLKEKERIFRQLREDMLNEAKNGMKQIVKDWYNIFEDYKEYKFMGLTTQESFYCALMDNGYMSLKDLK